MTTRTHLWRVFALPLLDVHQLILACLPTARVPPFTRIPRLRQSLWMQVTTKLVDAQQQELHRHLFQVVLTPLWSHSDDVHIF
jgi:hypothetical protein